MKTAISIERSSDTKQTFSIVENQLMIDVATPLGNTDLIDPEK